MEGEPVMIKRAGIYLREGDEYVGPFRGREDAERFLSLMELLGESPEGVKIVELMADGRPESREDTVLQYNCGSSEASSNRKQ